MNFSKPPFLRRVEVDYMLRPTLKVLRKAILSGHDVQSNFSLLSLPHPPLDQTAFKIVGNENVILLGIAMLHMRVDKEHTTLGQGTYESESLELLFDLHHDGVGWQQFIFSSDGSFTESSHLPYAQAHSSAYPLLRPMRWVSYEERAAGDKVGTGSGHRWFFVWLDARELFSRSESIGFNICRSRGNGEFSSWNFASGNGPTDATGFGILGREGSSNISNAGMGHRKLKPKRDFKLSVTYDLPDSIISNHYTPQRLREQMAILQSWGISRLYWIDYSNFSSFWKLPLWSRNYSQSVRHCGELLPCAVREAHHNGLEIMADFKVFDLGFNNFDSEERPGTVREFETNDVPVIPEIAAHPEWTMQSNANWEGAGSAPVATLRFFSEEPIRPVKRSEVQLLVSDDNRIYRTYRGKFELRQGELSRPHQRWTPAGIIHEKQRQKNWYLELSNLNLKSSFAALQIKGDGVSLIQRGYMLAEMKDHAGNLLPHTVATEKVANAKIKYSFWKEWYGWANITEPLLQRRPWNGNDLGFAMRTMSRMPTLLEPTYPGTRRIWLRRIEKLLDEGVEGVNLRILCHHNGPMNYLQFAFAPGVVDEFRKRNGRAPQATPEDYERIRILRGNAFTNFLRDAKALTRSRDKILGVQLESGIEVPPQFDTRMQIFFDYETWIEEKLVDEISVKYWTPYSRFVHEKVMPLARKSNIPVHIISRNGGGMLDCRALEIVPQLVSDAKKLGFAGYNFYEAENLIDMNAFGVSVPSGLSASAVCKARDVLANF